MTKYKVIIELPAQKDLRAILSYITDTLKEPMNAERIYTSIKEQILTLARMPLRHNLVRDKQFAEMGARKLPVENYIAFYVVNEKERTVHVLRILFNHREWQSIL